MRTPRPAFRLQCEQLEAREVPSFGTGGLASTDVAGGDGAAHAVAVQADGKIVAAGLGGVVRYNADGSLDTTFNAGGTQPGVIPVADRLYDVEVQSDGKVLVGGSRVVKSGRFSSSGMLLMRFNANGTPDTTFGTSGAVVQTFGKAGDSDTARSFAIQSDGKIVAAGKINGNGWGVARFNATGTLDTSFDKDGWLTTTVVANKNASNEELAIQADGKIVVGGTVWMGAPTYTDFTVVRYHQANGALDTGFGTSGRAIVDFLPAVQSVYTSATMSGDEFKGLAIDGDGRIVLAGRHTTYGPASLLSRLNANGTLDTSFSGDGLAAYGPLPGLAMVFVDVAVQSDGKIVAFSNPVHFALAVVRVNTDGSLDTTFSDDGIATFNWSGGKPQYDETYGALALQPDGKIVLAGGGNDEFGTHFELARLNVDGTLDV